MKKVDIKNWAKDNLKEWLNNDDLNLFDDNNLIECINKCKSPRISENKEITKADLEVIFKAFLLFKPEETKVLILGQDPYPDIERAHGSAFSFKNNQQPADDSLFNMFKAIQAYKNETQFENLTIDKINEIKGTKEKEYKDGWNTNLEIWAKNNGILLLNTALTFESEANPHFKYWENFTKSIITKLLNDNNNNFVVFLWGVPAQKIFFKAFKNSNKSITEDAIKITKPKCKKEIINQNVETKIKINNPLIRGEINLEKIKILMTSHPSNNRQSVKKGFSEDASTHFKTCDDFLIKNKIKPIFKNFPENNKEE